MSEPEGPRFEDTMDVLETKREQAEARFREQLHALNDHLETVRAATERSTEILQQAAGTRQALADAEARQVNAAATGAGVESAQWPAGKRFLRRSLNRLVRWATRDFLEVLDRRGDESAGRINALEERVDRLRATVDLSGGAADAMREALDAVHQGLQGALTTHREMLDLVNAKDAEVLQRAVAGPLRRMEMLFDEFGRQQEAMLSQLVGRRQELDDLVRSVAPYRKEKD